MIAWLVVLILLYALWYLYVKPDDRLWFYGNLIPGPEPWPIVGNFFSMAKNSYDELKFRKRMIQKYGHVNRIWVGNRLLVVCLTDPKDAERVLKSAKEINKSRVYKLFRKLFGNGLFLSKGKKWVTRRKIITPTFHMNIINQFMEVFDKKSNKLIEKLRATSLSNEINMFDYTSRYMLDIICETAMGIDRNAIDDEYSTKHMTALYNIGKMVRDRAANPLLLVDFFWKLFGEAKTEDESVEYLKQTAIKVLREKERMILDEGANREAIIDQDGNIGIEKKMGFLEMILRMKMDGNPEFQTDEDICEETNTFFFAGHDTTTTATCFTLEALAKHEAIQEKAYQEIKNKIKDPFNITSDDLQNLTYLESVLKESLRLFPPIPLIGRELVDDVELPSGYKIPAGASVIICMYYIHRHADHYENPLEFNPDNFSTEAITKRHPYAFVPFSAGPRNCIGKRFAMAEVKIVLAKILYHFKVVKPFGAKEKEPYGAVVLRIDEDHSFILERRPNE